MNRTIKWLNEHVLTVRWVQLTINIAMFLLVSVMAYATANPAHWWFMAFEFGAAGFILASILYFAATPALLEGMSEAHRAVMQAQIEKSLHQAAADFNRQHPEIKVELAGFEREQ